MKNIEKIRKMSADELAILFNELSDHCNNNACKVCMFNDSEQPCGRESFKKWLEKEG